MTKKELEEALRLEEDVRDRLIAEVQDLKLEVKKWKEEVDHWKNVYEESLSIRLAHESTIIDLHKIIIELNKQIYLCTK